MTARPPSTSALGAGASVLQMVADATARGTFQHWGSSRGGRPIVGAVYSSVRLSAGLSARRSTTRLLVFGGIHGDEPATVEATLELAARLVSAPPPGRVVVVPAVNPDGLAQGVKNAASDVDLNRNFPAGNFSRNYPPGYDPGPAPLSEPETALLARIVEEHAINAVVAVHAPFGCVNYDGPALPWARAVAGASGWPLRANIGYPTPGSLGSWLGVDRRVPVLTLELPAGPLAGFRDAAAAALDSACAEAERLFSD